MTKFRRNMLLLLVLPKRIASFTVVGLALYCIIYSSLPVVFASASPPPPLEAPWDDHELTRMLEADIGQPFLERCGNRNSCQDGLDCRPAFIGNRCFPTDCIANEIQALEEMGFNGETYLDMILEKAGVDRNGLIERARLFEGRDGEEDPESSGIFDAVLETIRENPGPLNTMRDIGNKCIFRDSDANKTAADLSSKAPRLDYAGLHIELGLLADFTYSRYGTFSQFSGKTWNRLCFGAGPQVMIPQVSIVYGTVTNSNDPDSLSCASMLCDLDILFPLLGVGIAGGFAFNGRTMWEATLGYGLGVGGGVATCAAWPV